MTAVGIDEHLKGPQPLTTALVVGRMYALSEAQRAVMREWFNMIPSPEVEVVDLATFAGTPYVRELRLRTTAHVVKGRVLNGPRVVIVSPFGRFMSACAQKAAEMQQQREVDTLTRRVEKLLKHAREQSVVHGVRLPGEVVHEWHAELESHGVYKIADQRERALTNTRRTSGCACAARRERARDACKGTVIRPGGEDGGV